MVRATIDLGCIIKKSPTAGGCWGNIVGKGDSEITGKRSELMIRYHDGR